MVEHTVELLKSRLRCLDQCGDSGGLQDDPMKSGHTGVACALRHNTGVQGTAPLHQPLLRAGDIHPGEQQPEQDTQAGMPHRTAFIQAVFS